VKKHLLAVAFLLVFVPSAWAARPAVSTGERAQLKSLLGQLDALDLAYVPVHMPANYLLVIMQPSSDHVTLGFQNASYAVDSAKATKSAIAYGVEPFKGKLAGCNKGAMASERLGGNTIYWRLGTAWRCVRAPSGRIVIVFANSRTVSPHEIALVITSVARIP
jgi:hypothetical protein